MTESRKINRWQRSKLDAENNRRARRRKLKAFVQGVFVPLVELKLGLRSWERWMASGLSEKEAAALVLVEQDAAPDARGRLQAMSPTEARALLRRRGMRTSLDSGLEAMSVKRLRRARAKRDALQNSLSAEPHPSPAKIVPD